MIGKLKIFLAALFIAAFTICAFQSGVAEAGLWYQGTSIELQKGCAILHGYFYNDGEESWTIQKVNVKGDAIGGSGYSVYSFNFTSPDINVYMPAGSRKEWTFVINDSSCPPYNGYQEVDTTSHVWYY